MSLSRSFSLVSKEEVLGEAELAGNYQIGVYYFPNYHSDPRNEKLYGKGWTEWDLVKQAVPRFADHRQPRVPLWGYEDESDSVVFAKKIDAAANHLIDCFLFDWYWYDDGPFLNHALEQGYLQAPNRSRLQFALMWAIHNWLDIFPLKRSMAANPTLLHQGAITRTTFDLMTDYIVEHYFSQPNYWLVDGCPYFSIYELNRLIGGLGGIEQTREALEHFREKTRAAGFPDLHLNAIIWGVQLLPGEQTLKSPQQMLAALNFNSVTSYVWIHHVEMQTFPVTDYDVVRKASRDYWSQAAKQFGLPYYPNVTMGWDSSPRTVQSDKFDNLGYPFMSTISNNTPAAFQRGLQDVKDYLDHSSGAKVFTINAWNEWTEGSYLEPDTVYGMGYLEAIKTVFS